MNKSLAELHNEDEKNQGYLKIGDIVYLTFVEKVYEGHSKSKHMEQETDFHFAKFTETPEFEYKGIVFSDGVTNKKFIVIPKQSEESMSASNLYKKCLFRIEVAFDCEYHIIDQ
mmetsp:Transcript_20991/g.20119  ORF Transcript_20991/g.20119 Transcript_20991/m.20119 type:complete len:114 (+) Transcript_20991:119-460(+)